MEDIFDLHDELKEAESNLKTVEEKLVDHDILVLRREELKEQITEVKRLISNRLEINRFTSVICSFNSSRLRTRMSWSTSFSSTVFKLLSASLSSSCRSKISSIV